MWQNHRPVDRGNKNPFRARVECSKIVWFLLQLINLKVVC